MLYLTVLSRAGAKGFLVLQSSARTTSHLIFIFFPLPSSSSFFTSAAFPSSSTFVFIFLLFLLFLYLLSSFFFLCLPPTPFLNIWFSFPWNPQQDSIFFVLIFIGFWCLTDYSGKSTHPLSLLPQQSQSSANCLVSSYSAISWDALGSEVMTHEFASEIANLWDLGQVILPLRIFAASLCIRDNEDHFTGPKWGSNETRCHDNILVSYKVFSKPRMWNIC